jgi:bacteriocin-like protein
MKGTKIMRELNEQELNQVAGGFSINYNHGTQAQAGGIAGAVVGVAGSSSVTGSQYGYHGSSSFAANKSFAAGLLVGASSNAASTGGTTVSVDF